MKIISGSFYFISDAFFEKVTDPYLKINYSLTKRPHYFSLYDSESQLYWMVPSSSKTEKFEAIIAQKHSLHKPVDGIKIVTVQNAKVALLFQDMFPTAEKYIEKQYIRDGQPYYIANPTTIRELEKRAERVKSLIRHGIKFTPTQPNALRVEKLMLEELSHDRLQSCKTLAERMDAAKSIADERNAGLTSEFTQKPPSRER